MNNFAQAIADDVIVEMPRWPQKWAIADACRGGMLPRVFHSSGCR